MPRFSTLLPAALIALAAMALPATSGPDDKKAKERPKVEVVFVLDTTSSMTGLIDGAKAKIWSICNQIAGGKPTPDLKVGLVAFRDKGDAYVTKVIDLSDDLDAIHGELKKFEAKGGGDIPEHVNQALDDAVNKIKWSSDKKTLKIIFLVGDAPPHMEYKDDVKYPETCKKAVGKDLIINTIQCGTNKDCAKAWKDIASKSEGVYAAIAQDGGVAKPVPTPHDNRLAAINKELADTTLVYGSKAEQKKGEAKKDAAKKLKDDEAADRAAFSGKSDKGTSYDLLQAIKEKRVDLEKVREEELPAELRKLKPEERKAYIEKLAKKRAELNKEAVELDKKRAEFLKEEAKKKGKAKDGFDEQVLEMLRKQAKKSGIEY